MLDIILIQHVDTGTNLLEYHQDHTTFNMKHSDIFSGFLNAIQSIMSKELDIGTVILITTKGKRGHNCIIVPRHPISVIVLCDQEDPIDLWREFGEEIAERFLEMFGKNYIHEKVDQFKKFAEVIKVMCMGSKYCE
ncbi:MAG: hypothetical protein HWN81_05070 [Candidatus Lokiarchaeota archaeon]|nr:hypothetical protein [Candidatus Lokiarchaeota archaeon]